MTPRPPAPLPTAPASLPTAPASSSSAPALSPRPPAGEIVSTRLVLLRHGETTLNKDGRFRGRADPPLTLEGERQAKSVSRIVAEFDPVALFTSPRLRARQTAAAAKTALRLEAAVDAALDDFDYGTWAGRTPEEAAAGWPALFAVWQRDPGAAQFPGGETVRGAVGRIAEFIARVARQHPGATVVAVTHDAIIRCAVCAVLDVPLAAFHRIAVDLAATTGFLVDPPRLLWMNLR